MSRAEYSGNGFPSRERPRASARGLLRGDAHGVRASRSQAVLDGALSARIGHTRSTRRAGHTRLTGLAGLAGTARLIGLARLITVIVLLVLTAPGTHGVPALAAGAADPAAAPGLSNDWRITPLGPEGADVRRLFSLPGGRRLALTAAGTFHLWMPLEGSFREGYWQTIDDGLDEDILLVSSSRPDLEQPLLLTGSGRLCRWWEPEDWRAWRDSAGPGGWDGPGGESGRPASEPEEPGVPGGGLLRDPRGPAVPSDQPAPSSKRLATGLRLGAFRMIGEVPLRAARQAVALIQLGHGDEARPLLLTRQGDVYAWEGIGARAAGGRPAGDAVTAESWPIAWLDPQGRAYGQNERLRMIRSVVAWAGEDEIVFALTQWEGLFVSRDGARSFAPVSGELPKEVAGLSSCGPRGLCAITADGPMLCDDAGHSWFRLGSWASREWAAHGEITTLTALGYRGDYLALTRQGTLLLASNQGEAWTPLLASRALRVHEIHRGAQDSEVLLATSRGVLAGDPERETWRWQNEGLREIRVQVTRDLPFGCLLAGTDLGVYLLDQSKQRWCPLAGECAWDAGEDALRRLGAAVSDVDLLATPSGMVLICLATDEGAVAGRLGEDGRASGWRSIGPRRPVTSILGLSADVYWLTGRHRSQAYLMRVEGAAWEDRTELIRAAGLDGVLSAAPHLLRTGGDEEAALLLAGDGLWSLSDAGLEPRGAAPAHRPVRALSAEAGIYLATGDGLYLGAGDGHWAPAGLAGERVLDISVSLHSPGTLVCRTTHGLYWSSDDGTSWLPAELPPELVVTSGEVDREGTGIFLGTDQGLFFAQPPRSQVTLREPRPVFSSPNPFSRHVVMRCYLDEVRAVDLPPQGAGIGEAAAGFSGESYAGDSAGDPGGDRAGGPAGEVASGTPRTPVAAGSESGAGAPPWNAPRGGVSEPGPAPGAPEPAVSDAAAAEGEIRVFSVHGQLVRRLVGAQAQTGPDGAGYWEWRWDGRTEHGQEAPNGIYLLSTRIGPQSYVGKLVKFR